MGTDDIAFQSSSTSTLMPPSLTVGSDDPNNTVIQTLFSDLRNNFCIITTVNVNASNDGPLFVAFNDLNNEVGRLTITSSGITLQLYGVEATFSRDLTGRFSQIGICVHDGVAELYVNCTTQGKQPFIVSATTDLISNLAFGQSIGSNIIFQVITS